jgi:hypothetical protein
LQLQEENRKANMKVKMLEQEMQKKERSLEDYVQ